MKGYRENWHQFAKEYVNEVERTLRDMGCFEDVDSFNLDLLGDSLTLYLMGKEELDEHGLVVTDQKGRIAANPAVGVVKSQQGVIIALMKELSLSLRQRRFLTKDAMVNDQSPLDQFVEKIQDLM